MTDKLASKRRTEEEDLHSAQQLVSVPVYTPNAQA